MAIKFLDQLDAAAYTATATTTGATPINPIQNFYPSGTGSDTTTDLAVDQAGNVVRTTQEATWNLTRTQVDALPNNSGWQCIRCYSCNKWKQSKRHCICRRRGRT